MTEVTKALSKELRIQKLQEFKKKEKPEITGIKIKYKGTDKVFDVYRIPLSYLVYNPYNGRIGTKVKTFEVNSHTLNPENESDIKIIEQFLWESNLERNKKTLKSLLRNGQEQYGIVSRNGYIIDGNRRASILNRINNNKNSYAKNKVKDLDFAKYFLAIILDDDTGEKEILKLETTFQMGKDEKLDYNATEKYLKCKQLLEVEYDIEEIAEMMGESISTIEKNLEILDLMDRYLETYDYKDMYSMLEKREGPFVDLNNYVRAYEAKSGNAKTTWNPDDADISDMISISFDYIRAKYEGKEFRDIAKNSKLTVPQSIFASDKLWNNFKNKHFEIVDNVIENPVIEYINRTDLEGNIVESLEERDDEWAQKVKGKLQGNLRESKGKLEIIQESDKPYTLLEKALTSLVEIDSNQQSLYTEKAVEILKKINSKSFELRKDIEKAMKKNE